MTGAQQERWVPNRLSLRTLLKKSDNKSSQMDTIQSVRETIKKKPDNQTHPGLQKEGFPPKDPLWTGCEGQVKTHFPTRPSQWSRL